MLLYTTLGGAGNKQRYPLRSSSTLATVFKVQVDATKPALFIYLTIGAIFIAHNYDPNNLLDSL